MRPCGLGMASLLVAAGCGDSTAPEEARFPIVEGIYNVETRIVANSCRRFNVLDGDRIYIFFQNRDGRIEFRPPGFTEEGVVPRDLGIEGELQPDGRFEVRGTYTISSGGTDPDVIVGFSMEGRFTGGHLEGVERQLASFGTGSCEVTFAFEGERV